MYGSDDWQRKGTAHRYRLWQGGAAVRSSQADRSAGGKLLLPMPTPIIWGAVDELEQPLWISEDEYKWIMNDDQKEFFPKARTYFDKHSPGLLQDHQCIDLGGMVIEGIKTPGHTPGGMSFYNRTTKEMIVSDNFCPAVMVWRPLDQSLRQLNETAEKIKSMDVDCFWVGHDLRPMKGALGSLWHKAARLALDSENFTPISGTDNVFICCDEEWKKKIAGKNIRGRSIGMMYAGRTLPVYLLWIFFISSSFL